MEYKDYYKTLGIAHDAKQDEIKRANRKLARKYHPDVSDEQATFTLDERCRCFGIEAEFIEELVEQGILEPVGRHGRNWHFPSSSLQRTRITLHLQRDLGVNLAGAALALDLLERIEEPDAQLHVMRGGGG